jgi:hypothetical protein
MHPPASSPHRPLTGARRLQPDFNGITEIDVPIYAANAFSFYTTYTPLPQWSFTDVASPAPTQTPTYYIDVCPKLTLQGRPLPVEGVIVCSTLSKFMGEYPADWDKHLRGISQRGYNMVHFTPLMMRGDSNSPYSIYSQLDFDDAVFPGGEDDVAAMVEKMHTEFDMLAMTDVVWNHTTASGSRSTRRLATTSTRRPICSLHSSSTRPCSSSARTWRRMGFLPCLRARATSSGSWRASRITCSQSCSCGSTTSSMSRGTLGPSSRSGLPAKPRSPRAALAKPGQGLAAEAEGGLADRPCSARRRQDGRAV